MVNYRTTYLVLHNLQADADGQSWSIISLTTWLTNDQGLGKLWQTMVNYGWLRCYFTNLWLTMAMIMVWELSFVKPWSTMVDWSTISQTCSWSWFWQNFNLPNHGQSWLTEVPFHKYGWPWFVKALSNHGQPWMTEVPFHKPIMVDYGWPWFWKALPTMADYGLWCLCW